MRCVIFGDLHLESGYHLGEPDPDFENTRMRDAERVLGQIVEQEADVLIFLGDMARTATPKPTAYTILADALRAAAAPSVLLMVGNHDYTGAAQTNVHVVSKALRRARVFDRPALTKPAGLQVGVLPWVPPSRLFGLAPHRPQEMHRLVAEKLHEVARGLAAEVDPSKPSLLVGHWLLSGGRMQSGASVIEANEPLLDAYELETGPWDLLVFGHNHEPQQLAARSWHAGPPMRGGFGEENLETGFVVVEWPEADAHDFNAGRRSAPEVNFVRTDDRPLATVDLTGAEVLEDWEANFPDGAVVRLRVSCTEDEAARMNENSQAALRNVVDGLLEAGASKVIGPQLSVARERRQRSDLSVETDPAAALTTWMGQQEVPKDLRPRVLEEAKRLWA